MLYMRCPGCGELLGNKQLVYETRMKEVCEGMGVDDDIISQGNMDKNEDYRKARQKIVNELCTRFCCKMRLMNYVDIVHIVKG